MPAAKTRGATRRRLRLQGREIDPPLRPSAAWTLFARCLLTAYTSGSEQAGSASAAAAATAANGLSPGTGAGSSFQSEAGASGPSMTTRRNPQDGTAGRSLVVAVRDLSKRSVGAVTATSAWPWRRRRRPRRGRLCRPQRPGSAARSDSHAGNGGVMDPSCFAPRPNGTPRTLRGVISHACHRDG